MHDDVRADCVCLRVYFQIKPFAHPGKNIAFQFDYITPRAFDGILSKFLPSDVSIDQVPRSGPAPVMLKSSDWRDVIEKFESATNKIESSKEWRDKMGWLREMYVTDDSPF